MTPGKDLTDEEVHVARELIGGYLEVMLEHYAKCKRACLRKSMTPREDTPADRMMMLAADSAGKAMSVINYMYTQLKHKKNIVAAWDRTLGLDAQEG